MKDRQIRKGTKARVNRKHRGCAGESVVITSATPHRYRGHAYYSARLTSGPNAGLSMRFLASELDPRQTGPRSDQLAPGCRCQIVDYRDALDGERGRVVEMRPRSVVVKFPWATSLFTFRRASVARTNR